MAGVVVLRSNFASTAWKSAFAERLIALCPEINPDAADEAADGASLQCREMEPGAAAQRWASLHAACAGAAAEPANDASGAMIRSRAR